MHTERRTIHLGKGFALFFERVRAEAGISSQQELATLLGVNRSAITQAKQRDAVPRTWLLSLSRSLGLNPDWLESGRGQVRLGAPRPQASGTAQASPASHDAATTPDHPAQLSSEACAPLTNVRPEVVPLALVPKVAAVLCAGGGSFETGSEPVASVPFARDWLSRKGSPEAMVLFDVMGASMEPEIKHGDTVLVDTAQTRVLAHGVYAVGLEDTVLVKRLQKVPGALMLLSDNRDYSPITLRGDEMETCRVLGRVVWIGRELA